MTNHTATRLHDGHPRLLWIVNHKTLMDAEVPIFERLGFSVFIPKLVPDDPGYRSARIEFRYDHDLQLPAAALSVLNRHEFYTASWSPTLTLIINRYFDGLITSVSGFSVPVYEAIRKFQGLIVARVFGREDPARYTTFFDDAQLDAVNDMRSRFVFGQGFGNLAQIEDGRLAARAKTLPLAVPPLVWDRAGTWKGTQATVLLLCPNIRDSPYYARVYEGIKAEFGRFPHVIMGRQNIRPADPAVLPYMTDGELLDLYSRVAAFAYPSLEPRHVHYSPVEAMIVGCPVLYMKGGMLDFLAGNPLPGMCRTMDEMQDKIARLLESDVELRDAIIASQQSIVDTFSTDVSQSRWEEVLAPLRSSSTAPQ
ncbi:MAG: glycosyltransferase [Thermomicrobiales bacterium]